VVEKNRGDIEVKGSRVKDCVRNPVSDHGYIVKKIVFLSILVIFGVLFAGQIKRGFLSLLIFIDSTRPPEKAVMGRLVSLPTVRTISIPSRGKTLWADLYTPRTRGPHMPLLLVHGVNSAGTGDSQLKLLARDLAMAGFLVLVPDVEGMKGLRMRPSATEDIVRSFLAVSRLKNAKSGGGMIGISYSNGPMLLAAADRRVRDRVGLIVSLGGYGDLRAVLLFLLTGSYDYGGQEGYLRPDESLRWALLYKNLDLIHDAADRETLAKIIEKRSRYELSEDAALARTLGPEGKAVYAFIANKDQKRFVMLYENLPPSLREDMIRLSPIRVLKQIKAHFIIVHGMEDYSIPYTESLRLADAVGDRQRVHLTLLPGFMHTELAGPKGSAYETFMSGVRLYGAIYEMLRKAG
jgi:dienelactone hydrolase